MRSFLKGLAYFMIAVTPIQLLVLVWGLWIVFSSDYSLLSLSVTVFWIEYLTPIRFLHDWLYTWIWNPYLDFIFGLPLLILGSIKIVLGIWLSLWLLKVVKTMDADAGLDAGNKQTE